MNIVSFKEIATHGPVRSHLSDMGSVYVPKVMGGVDVELDDTDAELTIRLRSNGKSWKRYAYIGISIARILFNRAIETEPELSTIPLYFEYDKDDNSWFTVITK